MYGVPQDLPIDAFVGREFNQIGLGRFQLALHATGTGTISVEGRWELRDSNNLLIDSACDHASRDVYRVHHIIDIPVREYRIDPPRSFALTFANGFSLTVFDDTPQYESFALHLDGHPSIYV